MRNTGGGYAHCIECSGEGASGNLALADEMGDSRTFLSDVRKHVRATGHSVCVTQSYEFFIEPADYGKVNRG
jgi:hypothetical protein